MSPDLIEHSTIAWASFEDRFSTEPRTVPVSGRPSTPPVEVERFNGAGRKIAAPVVDYVKHRRNRPGGYLNPFAGRKSAISINHCPDGKLHDWRSMGERQIECFSCGRTAMKHNMRDVQINGRRSHVPPVVLATPERFGPCKKAEKHRLVRNGRLHNGTGLEALCTLCGRTGERLPDVNPEVSSNK